MARQPVTAEQWEQARALWESDTKISYADVGQSLGISKQAVAKKAKADKWLKRMDIEKVVNKAHQLADRASVANDLPLASFAANTGNRALEVDAAPPKKEQQVEHVEAEEVDGPMMTLEQRAEQLAIAKRAEILARHRTELDGARNRIYQSVNEKDVVLAFARGKVAKITVEAMSILHAAERKAWGLDNDAEKKPAVLVIDRG